LFSVFAHFSTDNQYQCVQFAVIYCSKVAQSLLTRLRRGRLFAYLKSRPFDNAQDDSASGFFWLNCGVQKIKLRTLALIINENRLQNCALFAHLKIAVCFCILRKCFRLVAGNCRSLDELYQ